MPSKGKPETVFVLKRKVEERRMDWKEKEKEHYSKKNFLVRPGGNLSSMAFARLVALFGFAFI